MQLIRNAVDPHHIQRTHLIEMLWLSVATFATLPWGQSMSYWYRSYLIILNIKYVSSTNNWHLPKPLIIK
jgi:hypothetical protein